MINKSILTALFIINSSQFSMGQTDSFIISGKIKGLDSKFLSMYIYDASFTRGYRMDSIQVVNEAFSFTSTINKLLYAIIYPNVERTVKRVARGYIPAKSSVFQFFVFPGASVRFSGKITDFVDAYPSGDKTNNDFAKLNKSVYPLLNKSVNLSVKMSNKMATDSLVVRKMKDTIEILDKQVVSIKEKFVNDNPSSVAAIWLLSDMMIRSQVSNDAATVLFGKMNEEKLVGITYYTEVAKRIDGISATSIGKQVPDINSFNTPDGKKFELAFLRGKYVVLDFWGTWCGPCISGMPKMKEYLVKYKDKIEIVGVAQESDDGERWRKFLKEKPDYNWHHVLSRNNEDYILKFNVAGFPTKIIVDPEGKILARYVGEDDEIYKKLDEILK